MSIDLPVLGQPAHSFAQVSLVEGIGYGPSSQIQVTSVGLGTSDMHSGVKLDKMSRNSDGSDSCSTERWLRLYFSPPFSSISDVRLWVPNYAPDSGWALRWGASNTFRKPTWIDSDIATIEVSTTDPGTARSISSGVVPVSTGSNTVMSSWFVLQATWDTRHRGEMQAVEPLVAFAWKEI